MSSSASDEKSDLSHVSAQVSADSVARHGRLTADEVVERCRRMDSLLHLSRTELTTAQLETRPQFFIYGYNSGGRPEGLWVAPGASWIGKLHVCNWENYPLCCFIYEVVLKPDARIIEINTYDDFLAFEREASHYWINFDYVGIQSVDQNGVSVNYPATKTWKFMDLPQYSNIYETMLHAGIIFDSAEAALAGSKFYSSDNINWWRYPAWVGLNADGIRINNWETLNVRAGVHWISSLDVSSACIWNTQAVADMKLLFREIAPNCWDDVGRTAASQIAEPVFAEPTSNDTDDATPRDEAADYDITLLLTDGDTDDQPPVSRSKSKRGRRGGHHSGLLPRVAPPVRDDPINTAAMAALVAGQMSAMGLPAGGSLGGSLDGEADSALGGSDAAVDGNDSTQPQRYKLDKSRPAKKDSITARLIPDDVSPCAPHLGIPQGAPCASSALIEDIGRVIGTHGGKVHAEGDGQANQSEQPNAHHATIIEAAKQATGCPTEKCVLERLRTQLGPARVTGELRSRFKVDGPVDVKLLNNVNIDRVLRQWASHFTDFYPYNFNMVNYASYSLREGNVVSEPDTLATVTLGDILTGAAPGAGGRPARCAGCVINSDRYQGPGKHWMALFLDARGSPRGSKQGWSVEFFNSSGNAPAPEWVSWLVKIRGQMEAVGAISPQVVRATRLRHQHSRTECGLYSLFYIYARLNGVPVEYFQNTPVPDQLMFEFRQHLFAPSGRAPVARFNYEEWRRRVNVQWE